MNRSGIENGARNLEKDSSGENSSLEIKFDLGNRFYYP